MVESGAQSHQMSIAVPKESLDGMTKWRGFAHESYSSTQLPQIGGFTVLWNHRAYTVFGNYYGVRESGKLKHASLRRKRGFHVRCTKTAECFSFQGYSDCL